MAERFNRRELLAGVASVALLPTSTRPQPPDVDLVRLSLQFRQMVERAQVLEQMKDAGSAWKAWSDAIDEAEALASHMRQHPARSLLDLSLKFDALIWDISHDGPDENSIDKLRDWGDELRRMAGGQP